jgi:hypothetical protein
VAHVGSYACVRSWRPGVIRLGMASLRSAAVVVVFHALAVWRVVEAWDSRNMMRDRMQSGYKPDFSLPVPCDTHFECKRRTEFGDIKPKCQICIEQLYLEGSRYYGASEFTEESPVDPTPGIDPSDEKKEDGDKNNAAPTDTEGEGPTGEKPAEGVDKASSGSSGPASEECHRPEDDVFVLPCCKPESTGSAVVLREKMAGDLPCCGGGPACCRWCPEYLCDGLENAKEMIPALWWHVCSGSDTEVTTKTRMSSDILDEGKPKKPDPPPRLLRANADKITGLPSSPAEAGLAVANAVAPGATDSILGAAAQADNALNEMQGVAALAESTANDPVGAGLDLAFRI